RLQGDQVDRADLVRRAAAADDLEYDGGSRVRVLRQRQPRGRSPALESGTRATRRRAAAPPDADVQRLRRPGREPLLGDGPAEELLREVLSKKVPLGLIATLLAFIPL